MVKKWKGGDRLLALAEFLATDPRVKGHFDMGFVVNSQAQRLGQRNRPDLESCGTVACAMGWAPMVPALKKAGLRYAGGDDGFVKLKTGGTGFRWVAYKLFDIKHMDVDRLFMPGRRNRTPKQVALNIKKFVARRRRELGEVA